MTVASERSNPPRLTARAAARIAAWLASALLGVVALAPVAGAAEQRGPFKDCADCPEMIIVPAGSFVMGSPAATPDLVPAGAEATPTVIKIGRPFALGRVEVTRSQFRAFVADSGFEPGAGCKTWDEAQGRIVASRNRTFANPGVPKTARDDWPASCVSYNDAKSYVQWLAKKTGKSYRLPSEAEWEYAARAGSSSVYPWGDAAADGCDFANVYDLSTRASYPFGAHPARCHDNYPDVAPVGALRPNAFGLHDMIGNVAEWVDDCYTDSYVNRPRDGRVWAWLGGCSRHVVRGGSWLSEPARARSAFRDSAEAGERADSLGFRVAADLESRAEAKP